MSKRSPHGLSKGDRRRIDKLLEHLDQRPITGTEEATIAGASRLAAGLRDAPSSGTVVIALVPIAIAVLIGGASTNLRTATVLLFFFIGAAMLTITVVASRGQAADGEAARAVVEHRLAAMREAPSSLPQQPRRWGLRRRARGRRREAVDGRQDRAGVRGCAGPE